MAKQKKNQGAPLPIVKRKPVSKMMNKTSGRVGWNVKPAMTNMTSGRVGYKPKPVPVPVYGIFGRALTPTVDKAVDKKIVVQRRDSTKRRNKVLPHSKNAAGETIHNGVFCDNCDGSHQGPIVGIRYKCSVCVDTDYCQVCIEKLENIPDKASKFHNPNHVFFRIHSDICNTTTVPLLLNRGPQGGLNWMHPDVTCNFCKQDIVGFKYFCPQCSINICESCEFSIDELCQQSSSSNASNHSVQHNVMKMRPNQQTKTATSSAKSGSRKKK